MCIRDRQVIKIVNAAVSNHVGRRTKQFEDRFTDFSGKIEQLLSQQTAAPEPATTEEDGQADNRFKAMQAKLDRMEQEVKNREDQLKAEAAQRMDLNARNSLKDALSAAGVPGDRIKHAMAFLYDGSDKRVKHSESGELEFLVQRDGWEETTSLAEGVNAFLDSDEGKFYLPARNVAGSGNTGGSNSNTRSRSSKKGVDAMSDEEVLRLFSEAMLSGKASR